MNQKTIAHVKHLEDVATGQPWFGRSLFDLLDEVDQTKVHLHPAEKEHSLLEILYHMITWLSFAEQRIRGNKEQDPKSSEKMDWRLIDPGQHSWEKGVKELRTVYQNIIGLLKEKNDEFLERKVDYREYNFDYLVTGVTEHTIYHLGQIAYINKMFS